MPRTGRAFAAWPRAQRLSSRTCQPLHTSAQRSAAARQRWMRCSMPCACVQGQLASQAPSANGRNAAALPRQGRGQPLRRPAGQRSGQSSAPTNSTAAPLAQPRLDRPRLGHLPAKPGKTLRIPAVSPPSSANNSTLAQSAPPNSSHPAAVPAHRLILNRGAKPSKVGSWLSLVGGDICTMTHRQWWLKGDTHLLMTKTPVVHQRCSTGRHSAGDQLRVAGYLQPQPSMGPEFSSAPGCWQRVDQDLRRRYAWFTLRLATEHHARFHLELAGQTPNGRLSFWPVLAVSMNKYRKELCSTAMMACAVPLACATDMLDSASSAGKQLLERWRTPTHLKPARPMPPDVPAHWRSAFGGG